MTVAPRSIDTLQTGSISMSNRTVAIIPFPALGDTTIYLRLAQALSLAGAKVSVFSDLLASAADLFDWVTILPLAAYDIADISEGYDLLIADVLARQVAAFDGGSNKLAALPNLLAVSAKHFPPQFKAPTLPSCLESSRGKTVHKPFCPGTRRGRSMVGWVDLYVEEVFGLAAPLTPPRVRDPVSGQPDGDAHKRVLLFPTTPNPGKNYPLQGFSRLSSLLKKQGWKTEIICMPHEEAELSAFFATETIRSFPAIRELALHMLRSAVVVTNDSGGGHLGSMLGLQTFTITKKKGNFVWRPGFNENNVVISPILTLKWFSGRIWKPFIPLRKIVSALGTAPE